VPATQTAAGRRAVITITADHPSRGDARVVRSAARCGNVVGSRRCRPGSKSVPHEGGKGRRPCPSWWILLAVIWSAIAFWPARVAGRKGHRFTGDLVFSLFLFRAAIIAAHLVHDRTRSQAGPQPLWASAECRTPCEGGAMSLADSSYPLLNLFWTMCILFLWVIWIWILIWVFIDIFRSHDLSGWAKALWFVFVLFIPLIGVLVYLIARGGSMQDRAAARGQR